MHPSDADPGDQDGPVSIQVLNESGVAVDERRLVALCRFVLDRIKVRVFRWLAVA